MDARQLLRRSGHDGAQDSGITSLDDMDGATICVQSGTTTELNLADVFRTMGLDFTPVVFKTTTRPLPPTTKAAAMASRRTSPAWLRRRHASRSRRTYDSGRHHVQGALGRRRLPGDPTWADAVRWIVIGLIRAEESGITSANVQEMMGSDDPTIKRLLGVEGEMGAKLRPANDFMVQVLTQVGNYGGSTTAISARIRPSTCRGLNSQWTEGGLLCAAVPVERARGGRWRLGERTSGILARRRRDAGSLNLQSLNLQISSLPISALLNTHALTSSFKFYGKFDPSHTAHLFTVIRARLASWLRRSSC